jgi:hypothetical protein
LYRNQQEFDAWQSSTHDVARIYSQIWADVSDEEWYEDRNLEVEFYIGPAYEKVFGVKIRNYEDWLRWNASSMDESKQKAQSWSLDVPEDGKKFVEWMEDENTGRPVTTRQKDMTAPTMEEIFGLQQSQANRGKREIGEGRKEKMESNQETEEKSVVKSAKPKEVERNS